jgi:hydroxyethylthiazole kinase-like uncharacterized protein yjeF
MAHTPRGPQRVQPAPHGWPLHRSDAARAIERSALANTAPHALMRRAGEATARLALAIAPHAHTVWVAAGPGNNGGDGLDAAIHLQRAGKRVAVALLGNADLLPADAADALARARDAGVAGAPALPSTLDADLALDALLGLGARRAPDGAIADAIALLARSRAPVLAIDLPSGLHPDTGRLLGSAAVRALHTLSVLTLKAGLFTADGRDHAGTVWFDPIGVEPDAPPDAWLAGSATLARVLQPRRHAQHKGSFGDVIVVGGAPGMGGAALLAARAALALGAGRVYVAPLADDAPAVDAAQPELMVRPRDWALAADVLANGTVVAGCGGGDQIRDALPPLLHHTARLVLDADALNAIAADAALERLLRARGARAQPTVLTPHPLEAARLLHATAAAVQNDRLQAASDLAQRFGCAVLLKGSGSVVAAPGSTPAINPTGNALLASAGTGDVLAGALGALWSIDAAEPAACVAAAAAWLHGLAADDALRAGDATPLTALRLIGAMCAAAARLPAASHV